MKNFKKFFSLSIIVIILISLISYMKNSPKEVVEEYFNANSNENISRFLPLNISEEFNNDKILDTRRITYKINSEKIDGNSATVSVTVNGPDFYKIFKIYMQEVAEFNKEVSNLGQEVSAEESNKKMSGLMEKIFRDTEHSDRTEDILLEKINGKWEIIEEITISKLLTNIDGENIIDLFFGEVNTQ